MEKKLLELAVDIVEAQASIGKMTCEEIEQVLGRVYNALHRMRQAEEEGRLLPVYPETQSPPAHGGAFEDPRASIQEDKVICMECKMEFRQLTANHLRTHQLTPREYKKKWGFPLKQPLAAKMLTNLRSKSAKKRGLPEKLQIYLDQKRKDKARLGKDMSGENKIRMSLRSPA